MLHRANENIKDEVDALATSRSSSDSDTSSSHEGVLTSLLNEMDGVQELVGVTVVAATNRPEAIVKLSRTQCCLKILIIYLIIGLCADAPRKT
jgi:SpoVK/Ycf46/Vps4 family AAA+-type ATPase